MGETQMVGTDAKITLNFQFPQFMILLTNQNPGKERKCGVLSLKSS